MSGGEEKMFFFPGSGGRRLLGFLHLPEINSTAQANIGMVHCHPFGEEKMASHSIATKTARALCNLGVTVIRFDYSGTGDSEGELDEVTLHDWHQDLSLAIKYLKANSSVEKVGLWGLRLGAHLALRYAATEQDFDPACLILWQPVFEPEAFFKQFLRQKLSTEIATQTAGGLGVKGMVAELEKGISQEVIGYPISESMYKSFTTSTVTFPLPSHSRYPILLTSNSMAEEIPLGIKKNADALNAAGHSVQLEHIVEEPYWDRHWRWDAPKLTQVTVDFMKRIRTL